ncbi:hypothetical protein [Catenuloplanes japonicus]|uniref:hypothetical protein n=1 Tax=Catenuloplanes japonicus TaxID=33876 RepID=UPI00052602E9|nr:hypothetical protein [Catenuloplanes japonicus]
MIRRAILLLLPLLAALVIAPDPAAAADEIVNVVVVRTTAENGGRADTLAQIAQRTLQDPDRAGEILDLNIGRPQPGGESLTASGELEPGWILRLPDDASGPDVRQGRVSADTPEDAGSTPYFTWALVLSVLGALLLALLTVGVFFRRRLLRWFRERRRLRAENARLHREIQQRLRERSGLVAQFAADQDGPRQAWYATAELSAGQTEVYALRVSDSEITAWVTADGDPIAPWRAVSTSIWARPRDAKAVEVPERQIPPCLVRVGGGEDGALFVDLTWLDGVLAIGGSAGVAADVVRTLLTDLTTFRPDVPVLSVAGLGGEPVGVPANATRLRSLAELPPPAPAAGTDDGMVRLASRRCAVTSVIVVGEVPSAADADLLLAACAPGTGQVAVVLGDLPGAHWRWIGEVDGALRLPTIGVTVTAPAR